MENAMGGESLQRSQTFDSSSLNEPVCVLSIKFAYWLASALATLEGFVPRRGTCDLN